MKLIIAGTRPAEGVRNNVRKYANFMVNLIDRIVFYDVSTKLHYLDVTKSTHAWRRIPLDSTIEQVGSGKAYGPDHAGEIISLKYLKRSAREFPADWKRYGKQAGMLRNEEMGEELDALYLVWNGVSKGSADMKARMLRKKKPVHELIIPDYF